MQDKYLRAAIEEFFNDRRKWLELQVLHNARRSEAFCNNPFSSPDWANSHSGLGEMTQVT
jgi:hypothetical protein